MGIKSLRFGNSPGSTRLRPTGGAPHLLLRLAYHPDGQDIYSPTIKREEKLARWLGRLTHIIDIDDQVEACRRVFASHTLWTVVRGSDLEEGESQGLPVWSRHVGDPILASNITRRVDYALFMVEALKNDALIHEAPAIVGCHTSSALAYAAAC